MPSKGVPLTRIPPKDTIRAGRRSLRVGGTITLELPVVRIDPYKGERAGDGVTLRLSRSL